MLLKRFNTVLGKGYTLTSTSVKHYPQHELPDKKTSYKDTHFALRDAAIKPIELNRVTVAYLTTGQQEDINSIFVSADELLSLTTAQVPQNYIIKLLFGKLKQGHLKLFMLVKKKHIAINCFQHKMEQTFL